MLSSKGLQVRIVLIQQTMIFKDFSARLLPLRADNLVQEIYLSSVATYVTPAEFDDAVMFAFKGVRALYHSLSGIRIPSVFMLVLVLVVWVESHRTQARFLFVERKSQLRDLLHKGRVGFASEYR